MGTINTTIQSAAEISLVVDKGIIGPTGPASTVAGPTGPTGAQGQGIVIKGSVPTVGDLPSTGNTSGDTYIVQSNGHLYVWSGLSLIHI